MPLFEFVCADCGQPFEELVLSAGKVAEIVCPACQSQNVTKKISTFASKFSGSGPISFGRPAEASCSTGSV